MTDQDFKTGGANRLVSGACWFLGVAHMLYGLALLIVHRGSGISIAVLHIVGGAILLPPIVIWIRQYVPAANRGWVVFLFAFVGLPIAGLLIGLPELRHRIPAGKTRAAPTPLTPASSAARPSAPAKLAATTRFDEVPADHMLRPVQDALNAGDIDLALKLLSDRNAVPAADQPMKERLIAAIQKASDQQISRDPAAEYAERIDTYWLPQVRELPSVAPDGDEAFDTLRTQLAAIIANINEGLNLDLSGKSAAKYHELKAALADRQRVLFPSMRKRYAAALDARLFRRDIRAEAVGTRSTTLLLTGGLFSFNTNIEDTQNTLSAAAASLRFKKVSYQWSAAINERMTYTLNVPADAEITN